MSFAGFFVQLESVESQISKFDAPNCSLAECVGTKGESSLAARSAISREPRRECHGTAALQGGALRKPWSPIPVTTIRHHVAIDRAVRTTARRLDRRRSAPAQACEPELLSTLATSRRDSVVASAQFLQWDFPVRKSQEQGYIFRRDRSSQLLSGAARLQEIAGEQTDSRRTAQIIHASTRKTPAPPRHIAIREVRRWYIGPKPREAFRFHQLSSPGRSKL
jgi:hypothetical protein